LYCRGRLYEGDTDAVGFISSYTVVRFIVLRENWKCVLGIICLKLINTTVKKETSKRTLSALDTLKRLLFALARDSYQFLRSFTMDPYFNCH
jgi:hypothetical protein